MSTTRMNIYQLEDNPEDGTVFLRYLGFQFGTPPRSGDFVDIIVDDEGSIFTQDQRPLGLVVNVIHTDRLLRNRSEKSHAEILVLVSHIIGQLSRVPDTQDLVVEEIIPGLGVSGKPGPDYRINQ